jgi:hypothetical protein
MGREVKREKQMRKTADIIMKLRDYRQEETREKDEVVDIIASEPENEDKVLIRIEKGSGFARASRERKGNGQTIF